MVLNGTQWYLVVNDRRKFRSETSDNMDTWKSRGGKNQRGEQKKEKIREERRCRCDQRWESRDSLCFSNDLGLWRAGLAKAAGAEPAGQMREEKLHVVVARSTFVGKKAENTSRSDHFWKLRCRKISRRCGVKHISNSKADYQQNADERPPKKPKPEHATGVHSNSAAPPVKPEQRKKNTGAFAASCS